MSGLSRTPGKRVRVNSPPRVRIPLSPPIPCRAGYFFELILNENLLFLHDQVSHPIGFPCYFGLEHQHAVVVSVRRNSGLF